MPATIMAFQVTATKAASGSGNMVLQFTHPGGNLVFCAVIPSADFTTMNTSVNGGSAGTTQTFPTSTTFYTQDQNKGDYPTGYTVSL